MSYFDIYIVDLRSLGSYHLGMSCYDTCFFDLYALDLSVYGQTPPKALSLAP